MTILLLILLSITVTGMVSGTLMFWSLNQPRRKASEKRLPYVSIIIPARDEEQRLPTLLQSLEMQNYNSYEVIVVDDSSIDQTAAVATSYGATVINNRQVDDMTAGKSAACASGAEHAKGDWLLFLDADVQFKRKSSLEYLLSAYQQKGGRGLLSVQPFHEIKYPYENLSAIFNIIVMTGVNVFTYWKDKFDTAGSFGPVILSNKKEYERLGGHREAPESIMDDFALSSLYTAQGLPVWNFAGKNLITLRMYAGGVKQLIEGWTKNLATASQSTHGFIMLLIILWINGAFIAAIIPVFSLYTGEAAWIFISGIIYLLYAIHVLLLAKRTGNFHVWSFFLFPVLFLFFTAIFVYSLYCTHILGVVSWKGRKIKV